MKLIIKDVKNAGDLLRERIVLEAEEEGDIGFHAVFATLKEPREKAVMGGPVPHCFWLPDQKVKKGDLIILYTKTGEDATKKNSSGSTSYFYYWGRNHPVWVDERFAVLANISRWEQFDVSEEALSEPPPGQPLPNEPKPSRK